jgi:hypothetical protein
MAILRRAVALTLLVAVLVVACQPEGRTFQTTLPTYERDPLPVTLTDETGLVTGIAPAAVDPAWHDFVPALHALQGDPNAAVLSWTGGLCDQDTTVWFHVLHGGYLLNVAVHEKFGFGGCPGAAVPRAIRIATSSPIPADSVTVAGG